MINQWPEGFVDDGPISSPKLFGWKPSLEAIQFDARQGNTAQLSEILKMAMSRKNHFTREVLFEVWGMPWFSIEGTP